MKPFYFIVLLIIINGQLLSQNYALNFDGSSDYVSVGSSTDFQPGTGSFTLEAWIKPENLTGNHRIIWYNNNGSPFNGYYLMTNGTTLYAGFGDGSTKNEPYAGTLTTDKWYHVAVVRNVSAGYIYLYLNGVEISNIADATGNINYSGNLIIGGRDDVATEYFDGSIDEVRIWNAIRSPGEIRDYMYKELSGTATSLKAYYKMSNGSGTSLTDNSTNSHTGSFTGSPDWINTGAFTGSRNCLDFATSSSTYVTIPDDATLDMHSASGLTLEAWVYPTSYQDWDRIVTKNWASNVEPWLDYGLILSDENDGLESGLFVISVGSSASDDYTATATDGVPLNEWTHIAGTYDGTTMKIYINGIVKGTYTITGSIYDNNEPVTIGKNNLTTVNNFNGKIDEVRIWNVARTEAQIRANMDKPLEGNETGLVAYYRFDYGDPGSGNSGLTTLYDITVNNNDGTLNNFTLNGATSNWVLSDAFNTWLGSDGTSWSSGGNWSAGSAPSSTDNLGIYKYTLGNQPTLASTSTFDRIYIGSDVTLTLNSSVTLTNDGNFFDYGTISGSGNLTNNGYLEIDHNSSCNSITNNTGKTFKISSGYTFGLLGSFTNNGYFEGMGTTKFNGTSAQSMNSETYNNVEVDNTSGVSLTGDATVNGTLTITHGDLDLNGHNINLGTTGSLAENGGVVKGSSGYIKATATLNAPSASNPGSLGAVITSSANLGSTEIKRTHNEQTGNSNKSILRSYEITPTNNSGLNATLKFYYDDTELNGSDEADLKLFKSTDAGSTWELMGGIVNTTDNYVTVTSIDDFSLWSASDKDQPLPINLMAFVAICQPDSQVEVKWSTLSETNNKMFEIQQSYDGESFVTVSSVAGAGNSNSQRNYSQLIEYDHNQLIYLRLKQTDFDGKVSFSKIISIHCKSGSMEDVDIYPNPFNNKITIAFNSNNYTKIKIEIHNAIGKLIFNKEMDQINHQKIEINPNIKMPKGIYYISIITDKGRIIRKLVKE